MAAGPPVQELPYTPMLETKPGPKTTEFWTTLFGQGLGLYELVFGGLNVENEFVVVGMAILGGAYVASRGLAKQGIPAEDPNAIRLD